MRVAHLIVTYTDPIQTERMIRRMQHPDFDFYIHLDAKFPIESHLFLTQMPNVFLIKDRIDVHWAGFSTIQAILNSGKEILDSGKKYDFVSLMSGQDYPIKTPAEILAFYEARKGKLLLKYKAFEGEWEEGMLRVNRYHMSDFKFRGQYAIERLLNKLFPKRRMPEGIKFYGSSMFWAISMEALRYVQETMEYNQTMKRFFKFSWAADEFLFQTVILNSHFADQVVNENCHYYKHPPMTPNPKTFTLEDFNDIMASDRIFARKFKLSTDPELLDKIDAAIDQQSKESI